MGALTRDKNDRKKSCSLSLTMEKLPSKAREGSGKSSKPEQEPGGKDLTEETVILLSFYNVISICCPQKWLSFLETEDTETRATCPRSTEGGIQVPRLTSGPRASKNWISSILDQQIWEVHNSSNRIHSPYITVQHTQ